MPQYPNKTYLAVMSIDLIKHIDASKKAIKILSALFFIIIYGCSTEEEKLSENLTSSIEQVQRSNRIFKGIFATRNSKFRGSFELSIPKGTANLAKIEEVSTSKITLHTGEIHTVKPSLATQKTNSSDFKVFFESNEISFNFYLNELDEPQIKDVIYKNNEGVITAAEQTAETKVIPITGTYECNNCQDQNTAVNGIELNNEERIFNMLLTNFDGSTNISIQAFVGMLINTEIVVQENCNDYGDYATCVIKSSNNFTPEALSWSGIHRYITDEKMEACSNFTGNFIYNSGDLGSIEGKINSDKTCTKNTYYLSPSGNDSNTGLSSNDAWKSIAKINEIQLNPGDKILFEGSQEFTGNLYLDSNDANNSANPVKISTYGTGKATINAGPDFGIYAYNTAGILIDNLIISGNGINSNTNSGISFYNDLPGNTKLDLIEITNCEVYGFRDFGIVTGSYNGNSGYSNVLIENNVVHDILDVGISSYGEFSSSKTGYAHSNILVRNCEVYNIKGYNKGKHSGNGIVLSDVQNSVIEFCTVYNCGSGNTSCGGPVGIWYWDADQVTIQYSEAYNISSGTGCDGGGFDMDGGVTNGVMQYNYSHDNDGGGFLVGQFTGARPMENITVRFNVSENDAATNGGSVYLFNGGPSSAIKNVYVYNNTFYLNRNNSNPSGAVVKYSKWNPILGNLNFTNNIFYAANDADLINIPTGYEASFKGNLYYSSENNFEIKFDGAIYNSLESFRAASGQEINNNNPVGKQDIPGLRNAGNGGTIGFGNNLSSLSAYELQAGSPAIDSGIEIITDNNLRDFYGNVLSINNPTDIGAHQYNNVIKTNNLIGQK